MDLNQITLKSRDLNQATIFYQKLGLKKIVDTAHYIRILCPKGNTSLSLAHHPSPEPGDTVIYFECENLDHKVMELKAQGITFLSGPEDKSWLWREARLKDPDGHELCLFYAGENRLDPPWRLIS